MKFHSSATIEAARIRVLNAAAPAPVPTRTGPPRSRSHSSPGGALESFEPWQPAMLAIRPLSAGLPPELLAKYGDVILPAATSATLAQGFQPRPAFDFREVKIRKPLGTFKVPKKGPRAGQQVEECAMIRIGIWEIHCTCGTSYRFTSRSRTVAVTRAGVEVCRLSPDACRETFRRIFEPATAGTAICHLFQSGD